MKDALSRAALAISAAEGGGVFDRLAGELADILGVDVGFIAVFADPARAQMRMLAFSLDRRIRAPFVYSLANSPCARVVGRQFHSLAAGARKEFPQSDLFSRIGVESYAAYPLNDASGGALGLIGAMHRKPLENAALCEAILKIFAMRATAELEHSAGEARYRAIFNAVADSLVLRDAEFRVVDVNPAYEKMSGRPRAEALGRSDLTMSPPELTARVREMHARALAGEPVMFEALARRKNGERFDIETRGVPIVHEGRPHVLYIGRDITARKSAELILRSSEEQYRAIFTAATDALVLRDAEFRIVDVNPAYEALSGYARAEVIGVTAPTMRVAHGVEPQYLDVHRRALAGEVVRLDSPALRKDGTPFHIEISAVPMTYGGMPHVLYVGRDISERKRAEERLRTSEEQYRAIFNATADALVVRDAEFRIVDVNPAYESLSGYTREEVIGMDRIVANPPEMERQMRELHRGALAGEPVVVETVRVRKDGVRRDVELRGVPIQYRGAPHVLYIGRDIGERKRAESRLRQAERMEAIGHLSGGVAHDFNNLLAAIMGYVVLAAERNMDESGASQDPKLAGHLDKALASCRQARDLIQQMLTFSRGQRGSPRPLALADAAAESLKLLRSSLPASLQIETLFEESPVTLLDPVQLDQILLNLSINARDAMAGVGRIAVRVRPTVLRAKAVCASCRKRFRGEFVELSVTDSGPGIAPPVLERMFEPFFTTKEVGRGSGMGLATVHGIVHEHQGHVLVESAPGAGSSFRILLPMAADGTVAAPRDAAPRRNVRKPLNGRVLVVDDERAVADFMRELLESWGLQAAAATNPRGVLERIVREPLDLVILDQTMPGMTGISLAREIAMARPQLPVVLYTGNSDRLDKAELAAAGVRALLNKPVEPDALYDILRTHLG
jgi:PAS domain S-box-containing protein